uniref:Protein phosphatase 2C n=1 Tax=Loa loa TaxID=7209 RepID=A0A1I7VYZ6_LOALO
MCASEVATHSLVLAGISDSGTVIVNGIMLDCYRLSTSLSFHHIESVTKFNAEEEISSKRKQTIDESGDIAGAPAVTTEIQDGSMSEETISATQQWESHTVTTGVDPQIQIESEPKHDQDTDMMKPIASSDLFERKRASSLAAALFSGDGEPGCKAYVQLMSPSAAAQVIEACENEKFDGMERSVESVMSRLLFTLSSLKMSDPERHAAAVRRLQDLEEELRAAGAVCPPDTTISNAVSKMLASASPASDIQIRVNSSQHITTTKSILEKETPGMDGLDAATVQHLQQQLMSNMNVPETPLSSTEPNASTVTDQKHETMAEGFTSEDGSVVVSKKMTRVVTTTRTTLPGEKAESNAGNLIRLKVNEQVYSGSVDPGDQHIHLVPITKQQQKLDSSEQQQQQEQH